MFAAREKEESGTEQLQALVHLQCEELKKKNSEIGELTEMIETQATQLAQHRRDLNLCKEQLGLGAA